MDGSRQRRKWFNQTTNMMILSKRRCFENKAIKWRMYKNKNIIILSTYNK